MAKRPDPAACIVGGCKTATRDGEKVCTDHLHPRVLQEEIVRLGSSREGPWQDLLDRFPNARTLLENLAVLAYRAEPLKASAIAVTARSRGQGLGDGIVTLGDHIALPSYAASAKSDEGRLRAAVAGVRGCASRIERMLDPEDQPAPDPRPRCGRRSCPGPNVRQPVGIRYCGFCARAMGESKPEEEADPVSAETSQTPPESLTTGAKGAETAETGNEDSGGRDIAAVIGVSATGSGGKSYPARPASLNGNGHHNSRSIVVAALTMHAAAKKGLAESRAMFSSLDVRSVVNVEHLEDGSRPERTRWKVTLRVVE